MQIAPYLSFKGDCEAAFALYAACLGGQIGQVFRYAGSPMAKDVPAGWSDKVMHASMTAPGLTLMGADQPPGQYEPAKGFSLSIHLSSVTDAERIFQELSRDGQIQMPLQETFWAARFAVFVDRFGIPWSINCDNP
jgi:PhnB protein